MAMAKNRAGIYFGWRTVVATGIVSGLGLGFYTYGTSALFKPIARELGLNRAATSGATGIGFMVGSLLSPVTGWLVDKFGPKLAILAGVITVAGGLGLMNIIGTSWEYYLVWGVIVGTGANLGMTIAIDKALSNWFIKKIGLAMGVKFALIGFTAAVSLPLISWLISKVGWRGTCLMWAGILVAGIPFILKFVKNERPEHYGLVPDENRSDPMPPQGPKSSTMRKISFRADAELSFREAAGTSSFWILGLSGIAQFFVTTGFNTHCIPFLTELKIDPVIAGSMMGIMIIFTIPSRFLSGILADRIPKHRLNVLMALPCVFLLIGIGTFLINPSALTIYTLLIFYGIAHGLPTPLLIITISRYFGRKAFGIIFGTCIMLMAPAALFSPVITGWVFDTTGSYTIALELFAAASLFALLLLCFLKTPKIPD